MKTRNVMIGESIKKMLLLFLFAMLSLHITGCLQEPMPIPDFPLNESDISSALDDWDLLCTISEETNYPPNKNDYPHSRFLLFDQSGKECIAGINSSKKDTDRIVNVGFMPFYNPHSIHSENIEQAICFATRLFGGFRNDHVIYDRFAKEYPHTNTEIREIKPGGPYHGDRYQLKSMATWQTTIEDMTVVIQMYQPFLESMPESIATISIATDQKIFSGTIEKPALTDQRSDIKPKV